MSETEFRLRVPRDHTNQVREALSEFRVEEKPNAFSNIPKGMFPDLPWIELVATSMSSVALSVIANIIYAKLWGQPRDEKKDAPNVTEIKIDTPDGNVVIISISER